MKIINESASERKFKCPFCNYRNTREKLVTHVENEHSELIPEGYTAARVVFNNINHKEVGHCVQCKVNETKWNENTWRYERFCSEKCRQDYKKTRDERMMKKYKTTNLLNDEEQQKKMLANRRISGEYKFQDGGIKTYCGSYEKKTLEFYDKVLNVSSKDIETPGPTIVYDFDGKKHKWITDIFYVPFNLVHDIKDGGSNPNKRQMDEYRAKQSAKEEAIIKQGEYNYIRLTDNNFEQLILILAELKEQMIDDSDKNNERIVHINEDYDYESEIDVINPESKMNLKNITRLKATDENRIYYKIPKRKLKTGKEYDGFIYIDHQNLVGFIVVCIETKFIENIEVYPPYEGMGLIPQMIQQAINELDAESLTVYRKNTKLAKFVKDLGFEKYKHTSTMDYYRIKKTTNETCAAVMAAIPPLNHNIYLAGHPSPNVFTKALDMTTDKYCSNTLSCNDGNIKKKTIELDSNIQLYKYKGKRNINKILSEIYKDMNNRIEVEPSYFYEMITGRIMMDPEQINYDKDFEKVNDGFTEAKYKSQIECATLVKQCIEEITKSDFKFPIIDANLKKRADRLLSGYDELEIRQDKVGRFMVINTHDGKCSDFYYNIEDIPENMLASLNRLPTEKPDMIEEINVITRNQFKFPIMDNNLKEKKDVMLKSYKNLDIVQDSIGRFMVVNRVNDKVSPYYNDLKEVPNGMLKELNKGDEDNATIQYEEPKKIKAKED